MTNRRYTPAELQSLGLNPEFGRPENVRLPSDQLSGRQKLGYLASDIAELANPAVRMLKRIGPEGDVGQNLIGTASAILPQNLFRKAYEDFNTSKQEQANYERAQMYQMGLNGTPRTASLPSPAPMQAVKEEQALPIPSVSENTPSIAHNAPINTGASTAAYQGNQNAAKPEKTLYTGPMFSDSVVGTPGAGNVSYAQPSPSMGQVRNPLLDEAMGQLRLSAASEYDTVGDLIRKRGQRKAAKGLLEGAKQLGTDFQNSPEYKAYLSQQALGNEMTLLNAKEQSSFARMLAENQLRSQAEDARYEKLSAKEKQKEDAKRLAEQQKLAMTIDFINKGNFSDEQKQQMTASAMFGLKVPEAKIDKPEFVEIDGIKANLSDVEQLKWINDKARAMQLADVASYTAKK